ncbi:hypothetical protein E1211_24810 [Micromonospora sp. 15K316]|uniref:hypothetical protein n=1 Tax=Micromonospora sp. 15K316 TaxID=2530376 RepID=UPI00104EC773|nr:hypothetical protein [Micromonospora sp. 15K316]TDC30071.1 hypothetical protein E1211_24810 [Micromonospora sp. 15K316]
MTRPLTTVDRAITVRQPYGQCIAIGRKTVENRGQGTDYRGPVAIHAGKRIQPGGDRDPRVIDLYGRDASTGMPLGAVVAVANLVDCHQMRRVPGSPSGACCHPWGDPEYVTKVGTLPAYHLVLADAVLLPEPVLVRGVLWFPWLMPAAVTEKVRRQLAAAVTR